MVAPARYECLPARHCDITPVGPKGAVLAGLLFEEVTRLEVKFGGVGEGIDFGSSGGLADGRIIGETTMPFGRDQGTYVKHDLPANLLQLLAALAAPPGGFERAKWLSDANRDARSPMLFENGWENVRDAVEANRDNLRVGAGSEVGCTGPGRAEDGGPGPAFREDAQHAALFEHRFGSFEGIGRGRAPENGKDTPQLWEKSSSSGRAGGAEAAHELDGTRDNVNHHRRVNVAEMVADDQQRAIAGDVLLTIELKIGQQVDRQRDAGFEQPADQAATRVTNLGDRGQCGRGWHDRECISGWKPRQ